MAHGGQPVCAVGRGGCAHGFIAGPAVVRFQAFDRGALSTVWWHTRLRSAGARRCGRCAATQPWVAAGAGGGGVAQWFAAGRSHLRARTVPASGTFAGVEAGGWFFAGIVGLAGMVSWLINLPRHA